MKEKIDDIKTGKKSVYSKVFWNNVRMYLQKYKKSIQWLADETGLSAQSISSSCYLYEYDIRIGTVIRIAKALGATPQELLFGYRGVQNVQTMTKSELDQQKKQMNINETDSIEVVKNYISLLSENQINSVLNHALSYLI